MSTDGAGARKRAKTDASNAPLGTPSIVEIKDLYKTRWLSMHTVTYKDGQGVTRFWNKASRTTKDKDAVADAVCILAVLSGSELDHPQVLLVKQFRPPVAGHTIELPAGLIDKGERPETAALRELKEETGYTGTLVTSSLGLPLSPGFSDENCAIVHVAVDLDAPENKTPKQMLEDTEEIEVIRTNFHTLYADLKAMEKDGALIFAGLYTLAMGLHIGRTVKL